MASASRSSASRRSDRRGVGGLLSLLGALGLCFAPGAPARGGAFYSRQEALELAFPKADHIEARTFVLRKDQLARIEALSRCRMETKLVKVHVGHRGEEILGYAFVDVHTVRTLPEAFMVVLSPEGSVRSIRLLAFYEPLDYMPPTRWYSQFDQKSGAERLRLGGDIHGIVGATLSARATTRGVRRALALYEVLVESER